MTFIKPIYIRQFEPTFRSFSPRIALRAMSAEAGPKVNSNSGAPPATPLSNRNSQQTNFWKHVKGISWLTFGVGSLAAASYFTLQAVSLTKEERFRFLSTKQSPTEERLHAILKPANKANATNEIFLLAGKILHDLHTTICQRTYGPSPIELKAMPEPSMANIPDALKTKMENSFKAQMTNIADIEENLSKSYFTGPEAELNFALHVIHFKISVEYNRPYMKGEIDSATITPLFARELAEGDSSYVHDAYYAYRNCRDMIRQAKEQGETGFEFTSKGLTALPVEIEQIPGLTMLDLRGNNLTYLPPQIGNLPALAYLNLDDNRLMKLPAEIGHLTNLTTLMLKRNRLIGLPSEIAKLQNLKDLDLDYNEFPTLPKELLSLQNLQELHILGYLTKGQNVSFNDFTLREKVMLETIRTKTPYCQIDKDWVRSKQPIELKSTLETTKENLISFIASFKR